MDLKKLIKKRIEENVSRRDLGVVESYEYLIELIAIEYHTTEQSSITAVVQVCGICKGTGRFDGYVHEESISRNCPNCN